MGFKLIDLDILIVEDDDDIRSSLSSALNIIYKNVHSVASGNAAKKFVDDNYIDIIVTEMNMPDGTGADLIDYVVSHSVIDIIPIIITSAHHEITCNYKGFECLSIMDKPFNVRDIINEIDKLLNARDSSKCTKDSLDRVKRINRNANRLIKLLGKV